MPLKNRSVGDRAWNLLRLTLLWARKGGVFKRRLATELRLVSKHLRRLGHTTPPTQIHYFERELSFDKTPIFNVKMYRPSSMRFHLPHIPCINPPQVDFDYDFNDDDDSNIVEYANGRKSALLDSGDQYDQEFYHGYEGCQDVDCGEEEQADAQGIDKRAEEFIAKFYQQMRLQRQISLLQYKETPGRDTN